MPSESNSVSGMDPGILEGVRGVHEESAGRYKDVLSQAASVEEAVRKLAHQDAVKAAKNYGLDENKATKMAGHLDDHFNYDDGDGFEE